MNRLFLPRFASSKGLNSFYCSCRRFFWQFWANAPLKFWALGKVYITTIDVLEVFLEKLISLLYALLTRNNLRPKTLFNEPILHCKAWNCFCQLMLPLTNLKPTKQINNSPPLDFIALKKDFCLGAKMFMNFFFEQSDITIQETINCFQVNISNLINHMDHVYCNCSWFVDLS